MIAHEKPELLVGRRLGSYQFLSLLGTGGMGVVYKARDTRLKRAIAIKVLPANYMERPGAQTPAYSGGSVSLRTEPSEHHHHLRCRARRRMSHRDGICGRKNAGSVDPAQGDCD